MYPGLASWAKFSRPCGTRFRDGRSHADSSFPFGRISRTAQEMKVQGLKPVPCCALYGPTEVVPRYKTMGRSLPDSHGSAEMVMHFVLVGPVAVVQDDLPVLRILLQHQGENSIRISSTFGGSLQVKISRGDSVVGGQFPDGQISES